VHHLTATGRHLPYGITRTVLPATRHKRTRPALTPAIRLVLDLPTPEGWKAELTGPGVEPATFRPRVRRRTAAPARQPNKFIKRHSAVEALAEQVN